MVPVARKEPWTVHRSLPCSRNLADDLVVRQIKIGKINNYLETIPGSGFGRSLDADKKRPARNEKQPRVGLGTGLPAVSCTASPTVGLATYLLVAPAR